MNLRKAKRLTGRGDLRVTNRVFRTIWRNHTYAIRRLRRVLSGKRYRGSLGPDLLGLDELVESTEPAWRRQPGDLGEYVEGDAFVNDMRKLYDECR